MQEPKQEQPRFIYLGIPHYGTLCQESVASIMTASAKERIHVDFQGGSLLTFNFNLLLAAALNKRTEGVTHFAMLHADIGTLPGWLDLLLEEMGAHDADVCSAIVPIKDVRGVTSTAIVDHATGEIRRLTMTEVMALPETFGNEVIQEGRYIAINTGCWVMKVNNNWAENVCFNICDSIRKLPDGTFEAMVLSEDWNFSRWCHDRGLKVIATRKPLVKHVGNFRYDNQSVWGNVASEGAWLKERDHAQAVS